MFLWLGKLRQKQETRFALSCAIRQGFNSTSPQLPPAPSCLEELVPTGSLSRGKKAEAGGFLALP